VPDEPIERIVRPVKPEDLPKPGEVRLMRKMRGL